MVRAGRAGALVVAAMAVVGCESSGLSYREAGRRTQANYLAAIQSIGPAGAATAPSPTVEGAGPRRPFVGPARLAVAQVGEVAPPAAMLDRLRGEAAVFSRVEAVPSVGVDTAGYGYTPPGTDPMAQSRGEVDTLRRLAASTGADYLLLVGGSVDTTSNPTGLSLLNLTIIGAFIVPSRQTDALMKASGALVDARTGRVVGLSNAEGREQRLFPFASYESDTARMLDRLRDRVTVTLADRVIADCRADAASPAAVSTR